MQRVQQWRVIVATHFRERRSGDVEDGPADVVASALVLEDQVSHGLGQLGPLPGVLVAADGLPCAVRGGCDGGLDGIRGSAEIVLGDVADAGCLTGCVGSEACWPGQVPGGSHGVPTNGPRLHHRQPTCGPCSRGGNGLPRASVVRSVLLEEREHVLGAVGGPPRQQLVVGVGERPAAPDGDEPCVPERGQDHARHTRFTGNCCGSTSPAFWVRGGG